MKQEQPEQPEQPKVISKVALTDTGLEFDGLKIMLIVPYTLGVPPKEVARKFRGYMNHLARKANRPSIYELLNASLGIQERMENQEPIVN